MELNRRAYAEESQQVLNRQKASIDKLREDNETLKNEIGMIVRHQNRPTSKLDQELINTLMDESDDFMNKVEIERGNYDTITEQIALMKEKILHQKKLMGGVNAPRENQMMIQKQIRILENRLERALVKFNESIANNKTLREDIDNLRRERVVFDNIYRKMDIELMDKKEQMAEVIENSNYAYEKRDAYQMEVAAIDQANRKEQEDFEEQMEQLTLLLEEELTLATFQKQPQPGKDQQQQQQNGRKQRTLKSSASTKQTLNVSPVKGSELLSQSQPNLVVGDLSTQEEADMKVKLQMGNWSVATNKLDIETSTKQIQNFEEAFNKIRAATGISDIDQLVKLFIKNEDHNFSLFNYVNEQNNEIERLEEQINTLREEERKFTQESGVDVDHQQQILRELEQKLQFTEGTSERFLFFLFIISNSLFNFL